MAVMGSNDFNKLQIKVGNSSLKDLMLDGKIGFDESAYKDKTEAQKQLAYNKYLYDRNLTTQQAMFDKLKKSLETSNSDTVNSLNNNSELSKYYLNKRLMSQGYGDISGTSHELSLKTELANQLRKQNKEYSNNIEQLSMNNDSATNQLHDTYMNKNLELGRQRESEKEVAYNRKLQELQMAQSDADITGMLNDKTKEDLGDDLYSLLQKQASELKNNEEFQKEQRENSQGKDLGKYTMSYGTKAGVANAKMKIGDNAYEYTRNWDWGQHGDRPTFNYTYKGREDKATEQGLPSKKNAKKDHAYEAKDGTVYVYNGEEMIPVH